MHKKFVAITLFAFISLCIWILWSTNIDMNNTLLLRKSNYDFMNKNLINPANTICDEKPFLAIIVTSYVGHVELRSAHRRAMPAGLLKSMNAIRIFLLAKIPPNEKYITQEAIQSEQEIYGDILQGSFLENYRNLTYKHLMGLNWASNVCRPTYILKVDDDIVFNINSTHKFIKSLSVKENLLVGYMLNNTKPRRNKENKWYVTQEEYVWNDYPPYLSGWYYIATSDVAARLCEEALYIPPFWIDDIYITGILSKAIGAKLTQVPQDYWLEYYELLECCLTDMINKFIRCDFVVGPNGGRNNLIVEFNQALNHCDQWRNCTARPKERRLKDVCVVNRERDIFSDGQGEVHLLKL
ncbi:beta-1,3-galactosyltransferase 5-like [Ostrinia nubilalis]|uniref:beta-1,3-galactosyltransferase 5-like n=1 Tax=Ostrinia nubilalis TaxID=29057 RepID=UPI00308232DC